MAPAAHRRRGAAGRRVGLRGAPGRRAAARGSASTPTSARSRTRSGWIGTAVHLDKGCYRGQETVARVHNLGKPPRMLVLLHLDGSADRPVAGDPVLAGGRTVGRLGTVVDHVDEGPIALALLKRGLPADTDVDHRRRIGGGRRDRRRLDAATRRGRCRAAGGGTAAAARTRALQRCDGPASAPQPGTVKCWQDDK